ncbi:MAG TPA: hydroxymethylpyrimidine/phosphomethylpyrimidine kinase [bacterium]|jgi:hydroxymethylpyrimidine/phosphomethylpyrimidine kinase|nr:hydroxymethylpyrimidine/phosphomethylpyrimidine kinase [bacterium]
MSHPAVVLAIGGLDPTGHAGLAADLRAGAALNVFVAPVASALTVQDQQGVKRVQPVDADLLKEQIAAALRSLPVGAVKIGLLPSDPLARAVAQALSGFSGPLVLDPVLSATPGGALADAGMAGSLRGLFAARTTVLTPNLAEAAVLLGGEAATDAAGMESAARDLGALGFKAVLMKGGHLSGPRVPDYLFDTAPGLWIDGARLETPNTRGTGCILATLVAGLLAQGQPLRLACIGAKNALVILLRKGAAGRWPLGPGPVL